MLVSMTMRVVVELYPPVGVIILEFDAVFRRNSVGVWY